MILRELFYSDVDNILHVDDDNRYDPSFDETPMKKKDTRKVRLTLKQINRIRKASDLHKKEREKELSFIKQMYGAPEPNEQAPAF